MTAGSLRPIASSPEVSRRMRSTRQRDTEPEVALRVEVRKLGLRYRIDRQVLPELRRRADLVFVSARVAVFVDGCFWHRCPVHRTQPVANADWWDSKLRANERRDRDTDLRLARAGWTVMRVWEHERPAAAAIRLARVVRSGLRRGGRSLRGATALARGLSAPDAGRRQHA